MTVFEMELRESLKAYVKGNIVIIEQGQQLRQDDDPAIVYFYADQVPVIVGWLQTLLAEMEAKAEA